VTIVVTANVDARPGELTLVVLFLLVLGSLQFWAGYRTAARERKSNEKLYDATVTALAMAIEAKDHRTFGSIHRVKEMAVGLAQALGIRDPKALDGLRMAALLHDIGKLAVPEYILNKPGRLSESEAAKLRAHPLTGAEILETIPFPYPVAPLVKHHHERWDGSGYPSGLRGESIPVGARILAVVDCYIGLRSDRPFRPSLSRELAYDFIRLESGTAFDPEIVRVFIQNAEELERAVESSSVQDASPFQPFGGNVAAGRDVFADIASTHREVQAVYEITQSVGKSLSVADTLASLVSKIRRFVPYSSCAAYLLNAGDSRLLPHYCAGMYREVFEGIEMQLDRGLSGWAAANNRTLISANPELDFPYTPVLQQAFRSCISVPLAVENTVVGVVTLYSNVPGQYQDEHVRLLEAVAPHSARAINNAVIYEATQEDANTDPLTGLPNIRSFQSSVNGELNRARRIGYPVSILMMDLDGFKRVNDLFGHQNGDALLVEVGRLLRGQLRKSDTCLRYGGDEFLAVLPGLDRNLALQAAARIQTAFSIGPLLNIDGENITVGISIGIATFPADGTEPQVLVAAADQDMFRNKKERKPRSENSQNLLPFRKTESN